MGGGLAGWKDTSVRTREPIAAPYPAPLLQLRRQTPWLRRHPQARADVTRWLHADQERAAGRTALADLLDALAGLRPQLAQQGCASTLQLFLARS